MFTGAFSVYLAAAILLAFKYQIYPGDAVSRMANAFYVLYSRDPHLAAIGFAWNPLQSLCDMVFLLFKAAWPALATHDMAGSLVSSIAMAGAVYQMSRALAERGLGRAPRVVLTSLFAFSPMILFFGANGMSEALYLFTLVATTRYLLRWLENRDVRSLVYAGTSLGLAFLARNEAIGAAVLGTGLVILFGILKREHSDTNLRVALTDSLVFSLPFIVALFAWAVSSYVITGQLFPQVGANAVLLKATGSTTGTLTQRLVHELTAIGALAPVLLFVLVAALLDGYRRRNGSLLVPLAILGGGLAFDLFSYADGSLFPWLRYYILVIPLATFAIGELLLSRRGASHASGPREQRPHRRFVLLACVMASCLMLPSFVTSSMAMVNKSIGAGETSEYLPALFDSHKTVADNQALATNSDVRMIDGQLGHMRLHDGSVIVDNVDTCVPDLIVQSTNPKIFVIPNDRDFQRVATDPLTFHATYFLLPPEQGVDAVGSLAHQYPSLYSGADSFAQLVGEYPSLGTCPAFRLFRVLGHPPGIGGYG